MAETSFRLGDWLVEPRLNRLTRGDESIQIELKMMDVLVCLAGHAGDLVTRQEIIDTVWAIEFITEKTLTRAVAELRRTLGDDAREPRYIETIHRRGYRLIAPVEKEPEASGKIDRFPTRALRDDRDPYPGLAPFTEADAEFFCGREADVAQLWRTMTTRRLLAVIGPSGVGKTSFLRAGVIPAAPRGWGVLICQPGEAPFASLVRALAPEISDDPDAVSKLVDFEENAAHLCSRWRGRHERALLIVDQFEELFTLSPPDTQSRFAELLGTIARTADVHVLLSMRDDFLYRCQEFVALRPVLESLAALQQPDADGLRRALEVPAQHLGFRFEGDELPTEMVAEVTGERGALPLLAFAVARLWGKRDRERRLLTRQAYEEIGGVGGALARHAEATIDRIGSRRISIVREIFRNLVTAEGTRAVREWDELLSVFRDSPSESQAEEVLRQLIAARLLTSYEVRDADEAPARRVEIVHESLLANWPRLVRWRTQDADAAQVRDQLRQAARTWDEHDRSDDMLWTGSAYREFAVWRERYPGGLTELEEAFVSAVTSHAARRRRSRRIAGAAALIMAIVIAAVFGALWRRGVAEARRAEATKLLALAQAQLDTDPTEALAYATASLGLADTSEARVFAVKVLWTGPPVRAIDLRRDSSNQFVEPTFSPDGRWLAVAGLVNENVLVYNELGGKPLVLGGHAVSASGWIRCAWSPEGLLVTGHNSEGRVRVWSMPEGSLVREIDLGGDGYWQVVGERLIANVVTDDPSAGNATFRMRSWELREGEARELGEVDEESLGAYDWIDDPGGRALIYTKGNGVYARPLPISASAPDVLLARHSSDGIEVRDWRRGEGFYSRDRNGEIVLWHTADGASVPGRRLVTPESPATAVRPDPSGRWAVEDPRPLEGRARLWDLAGLPSAEPWDLRRNGYWHFSHTDVHPDAGWVAATTNGLQEVSFWPLPASQPFVAHGWILWNVTPDGRYLLTSNYRKSNTDLELSVRLWPLPGSGSESVVDLMCPEMQWAGQGLKMSLDGQQVLVLGYGRNLSMLSVKRGTLQRLEGFPANDQITAGGFSPSGRLVAAASGQSEGQATLRVWDREAHQLKVLDQPEDPEAWKGYAAMDLSFVDETTLYTAGANGLLRWDLVGGSCEQVEAAPPGGMVGMSLASDRRMMLTYDMMSVVERSPGPLKLHDLTTGEVRVVETPGTGLPSLSADGAVWVSGEMDGTIWVGRTDGGEPHLLLGHVGPAWAHVSPDRRWIASWGDDTTIRLWPMPDLSKPPLHTLPREELIAKLNTLTNLRAVRDDASSTGWKIEIGPFPGWVTVPTW